MAKGDRLAYPGLRRQKAFSPCARKNNWRNARSGSDQCSVPNAQFSAEVDVGLRVVRPMQDKIALSDQLASPSVRIRIEHWELNIGQIPASSLYLAQVCARPPSMEYVTPVIQPAFDEARNRINSAISSGSPMRPRGWVVLLRSTKPAYVSSVIPELR